MPKEKEQQWITVAEARQNFAPALKAAWPYTLLGLAIGLTLLTVHHIITAPPSPPDSLTAALVKDLGIGFIVSAIAVFFYEWGAEAKKAMDLGEKLVNIITVQGEKALGLYLKTLLGADKHSSPAYLNELTGSMESLVKALSEIQSLGTWAKEEHVHFISDLLDTVVVRNAESLRALNSRGEYHFTVPPTGAEMADKILAAQMRTMMSGDSYDVISNLTAWKQNQLSELHKETERAIKSRNVKVRRLFNMMREYRETLTPQEARKILETHLKNTEDWGPAEGRAGYEVKILGPDEYETITNNFHHDRIREAHFGIFTHEEDHLRVKVERHDLSDMVMSKDLASISTDLNLFKEAWFVAVPLSNDSIDRVVSHLERRRDKAAVSNQDSGVTLEVK